jgi:hypothetical protein
MSSGIVKRLTKKIYSISNVENKEIDSAATKPLIVTAVFCNTGRRR